MNKEGGTILVNVIFFIGVLFFVFYFVNLSEASVSSQVMNASLIIWNNGTTNAMNLTLGNISGTPISKTLADRNFKFRANFTNITGEILNSTTGGGLCQIRFNESGSYGSFANMTYNETAFIWELNRSFNYKGNLSFNINCTSTFGNISLTDYFKVQNTRPWINKSEISGIMNAVFCTEDNITSCTYNLTIFPFLIEDDFNDLPLLQFTNVSLNTTLTSYTLSSSGYLLINKSSLSQNTSQNLKFTVSDTDGGSDIATLPVSVAAVNDAPLFDNLQNQSFNISSLFSYVIGATDEENNVPFVFNITFLSCSVAPWSNRNCSTVAGMQLFTSGNYTANNTAVNISYTPLKNDVGNYTVNVTARDLNNALLPVNASTSFQITLFVQNVNNAPYFRYLCDNERNATENLPFNCNINVSDLDETSSLNLSANYTWFIFNSSVSSVILPVSSSTLFNGSALVTFTPTDSEVGNWSINISAKDSNSLSNSTVINFYVANVNDSLVLGNVSNVSVAAGVATTFTFNASDNDVLIPDKNVYNESLTATLNESWITLSTKEIIDGTNITQFTMSITAPEAASGNNAINLTVRDANNYSIASRIFFVNVSVTEGSTPTPSTSGGGSTQVIRLTSLKIILPDAIIVNESKDVIFPITLHNDGQVNLFNISLTSVIAKNGTPIPGIIGKFFVDQIPVLYIGEKRNTTLTIPIDISKTGVYEVNVRANVKTPNYNDSAKTYIDVEEGNLEESRVKFAEQLVVSNAECTEIMSILNEAKELYAKNEVLLAQDKVEEAISACRSAVEKAQAEEPGIENEKGISFLSYFVLTVVVALAAGFFYYFYQQFKLKKILDESDIN